MSRAVDAGGRARRRLEADSGRMLVDSLNREAELEEVTDALLLSRSDDFNALAATELRADLGHGHVYRIAPDRDEPDLLPPATEANILGDPDLTLAELTRRLIQGQRFLVTSVDSVVTGERNRDGSVMFVIDRNGDMRAASDSERPTVRKGDTMIKLVASARDPS